MSDEYEAAYPPLPRQRIDALGIHTNYYTAGDPQNETVVLLHGMSTSGDSFREVMHRLAEDYYLIAPDIPGFGYSDDTDPYVLPHLVEWLAAFFDALEIRPAHSVGHSFGGVLASAYSLSYPEDVRSQALLAPAVLVPQDFPNWMLNLSRLEISESLISAGVNASRSRLLIQRQIRAPFYNPDKLDASLWARREEEYARARASAAVMRAVALHDLRDRLPQLPGPHCIIWGENDEVVDPAGAATLASILPAAEVHLLAECGHAPQLERQEEVSAILRDFWRRR